MKKIVTIGLMFAFSLAAHTSSASAFVVGPGFYYWGINGQKCADLQKRYNQLEVQWSKQCIDNNGFIIMSRQCDVITNDIILTREQMAALHCVNNF